MKSTSRYNTNCPSCGAQFSPLQIPLGKGNFPCPICGVRLVYAIQHTFLITAVSAFVATVFPYILGFRGLAYTLCAICLFPVAWMLGIFIAGLVDPSPAKIYTPRSRDRISLNLTDKN